MDEGKDSMNKYETGALFADPLPRCVHCDAKFLPMGDICSTCGQCICRDCGSKSYCKSTN